MNENNLESWQDILYTDKGTLTFWYGHNGLWVTSSVPQINVICVSPLGILIDSIDGSLRNKIKYHVHN